MKKETTKKKAKKNKKIKKEKFSADYNRLIDNLYNILGLKQGASLFGFSVYTSLPCTKEEEIIQKIISLKVDFAREDEGTKLEAENKKNLMEVIQMLTGDEARLLEAGKKIEQIKQDNKSCDCNED